VILDPFFGSGTTGAVPSAWAAISSPGTGKGLMPMSPVRASLK